MTIVARYYDPASSGPRFELAKEGQHAGIIVDVQDLGTSFNQTYQKAEHKVKIVVELDELTTSGKPIYASLRRTLSLHPKSSLTKDIRRITGVAPSGDLELEQALVGLPVNVLISHKQQNGSTFQRIDEIWKGDGSYKASGQYRPWKSATFRIGRTVAANSGSGKPYLSVFDEDDNELTQLWNLSDQMVAANAPEITVQYRDKGDGTIKVKEGSVKAAEAA